MNADDAMTLKRGLAVVILVIVGVLVTIRMRGMAERARELEQEVRAYRPMHQRACSLVEARLSGARVEVAHRGRQAVFDEAFVRRALLEVLVFAATCVAVPPSTAEVAERLRGSAAVTPNELTAAVVALDDAFMAAVAADWPPPR